MAAARAAISAATAATALAWALRKLWRARRRRRFDGLEGVVSFSSRLIAAVRAAESLRADALFVDPLATVLAGSKAMARLKAADKEDAADRAPAAAGTSSGGAEERLVPRLVLRTAFFDDATLLATGQPQPRAENVLQPVLRYLAAHPVLKPCSQVVMLGAGMDARPWRLALGSGTRWFEVDRQDVLAAKQRTLKQAGASFQAGTAATTTTSSSAPAGSGSSCKFALRVGEWACASADLQQPGWVGKLLKAGLDPTQPTAWVAEGLLYYMEPASVPLMLQEAAAMSVAGSMVITNFMTESGLALLHSAAAAKQQQGVSSSAEGRQAATSGSSSQPQQQQLPPRELQRVPGLLSSFKFGVPDDCEKFFDSCGWQLLLRHGWKQASHAYGWQPLQNAPDKQRTHAQEVQMVVGVVKK